VARAGNRLYLANARFDVAFPPGFGGEPASIDDVVMVRRCGDVQLADLGEPRGREAGFARPVVVVTAQVVLDQGPSVVQVVPLTSTIRAYRSEVTIEPDPGNGHALTPPIAPAIEGRLNFLAPA
jgi:mRNA-degrading endonuclease toxin of MazEF toxin-antitoxin module